MLSGCRLLLFCQLSPLNTPFFTDGGRAPYEMESDSLTEKAVFSPSETFLLNSWITYRLGGQKARESPENAFFAILPYSDTLPGLGGGVPHHVEGMPSRAYSADCENCRSVLSAAAPDGSRLRPPACCDRGLSYPESIQDGESLLLPVWYFRGY